jgi:hypothetical protein
VFRASGSKDYYRSLLAERNVDDLDRLQPAIPYRSHVHKANPAIRPKRFVAFRFARVIALSLSRVVRDNSTYFLPAGGCRFTPQRKLSMMPRSNWHRHTIGSSARSIHGVSVASRAHVRGMLLA